MKSKKIFFVFLFSVGILADSFEEEIFKFAQEVRKEVFEQTQISDSEEVEYGRKLAKQMKREFREIQNSSSKTLQEMGKKIASYRKRKSIPIEFHLIESEEINAFATAGGHVWVTTGILNFVQSKDELAGILGHEVAHLDLEHSKKLIQIYVYTFKTTRDEDFSELANLISLILNQPFSQEQELEADSLGIEFAHQAGFDAKRTIEFFERLEATYRTD
ncbi:MAG: M48 family metalloprotease, partial [Leptospiraceae bacterium]|nr:M48 family metalloprotease [Leptospiraceae bacterium]